MQPIPLGGFRTGRNPTGKCVNCGIKCLYDKFCSPQCLRESVLKWLGEL